MMLSGSHGRERLSWTASAPPVAHRGRGRVPVCPTIDPRLAWGRRFPGPAHDSVPPSEPREEPSMATGPIEQVGTRLMFENERVRVWDLALEPGESFAEHIHRLDYFYIVESGGLIRFADPDQP